MDNHNVNVDLVNAMQPSVFFGKVTYTIMQRVLNTPWLIQMQIIQS